TLDLARARTWAGDLNGDGAADLLVGLDVSVPDETHPDVTPTGMRFQSALSAPPQAGLKVLKTILEAPELAMGNTLETLGDLNRDGRDDLFLAYGTDAGTRIDVIQMTKALPKRLAVWAAPSGSPLPIAKLKLASADVNLDGLADLVLYKNRAEDGTSLVILKSSYGKLKTFTTIDDPTLDWTAAQPY
ncbi:MAG: hypothetical protein QOG62_1773, partial [Thermoleophilaceae bacterium]|nr:hypothetical protein [Thermoleophilaceae bacterium]